MLIEAPVAASRSLGVVPLPLVTAADYNKVPKFTLDVVAHTSNELSSVSVSQSVSLQARPWRGVVAAPYQDRVLYTQEVAVDSSRLPRLAAYAVIDPELFESDDWE